MTWQCVDVTYYVVCACPRSHGNRGAFRVVHGNNAKERLLNRGLEIWTSWASHHHSVLYRALGASDRKRPIARERRNSKTANRSPAICGWALRSILELATTWRVYKVQSCNRMCQGTVVSAYDLAQTCDPALGPGSITGQPAVNVKPGSLR